MITFPAIWIQLAFYIAAGILFCIAALNLLNAFRHGSRLSLTTLSSIIFVVGLVFIFTTTLNALHAVDWTGTFSISTPSTSFIHFGF